jgi:hypothetical protein
MEHRPAIEAMLDATPLLSFSVYTPAHIQNLNVLRKMMNDLSTRTNGDDALKVSNYQEYYAFFWFWVLGAYEILRTMDQHKETCFCATKHIEIRRHKKALSRIRIPFAKQELEGENKNVHEHPTKFWGENSVCGVDVEKGWAFSVKGNSVWTYELINETHNFLNSFHRSDILARIPQGKR